MRGIQIGAHPRDGTRPRVTAIPQVEYKAGIADNFASESGWRNVTLAEKFFHFSKQMHVVFLIVLRDSAGTSFPMQFLLV